MDTPSSQTLYLRYEERHLPPEWIEKIHEIEEILVRHNVRVINLLDRIRSFANPKIDLLATSDAMLAIVGKEEPTVLLAAAELVHLNRNEKPSAIIHNGNEKTKGIAARTLVEAKDSEDLARLMRTFVAEMIGAELPDLREELESVASPRSLRHAKSA